MTQHLTRLEQANLLAGHAVSYATAYLDGRHDASRLADNADRLFLDLLVVETEDTSGFLIPVQLLAIVMMRTAKQELRDESPGSSVRQGRWQQVMGALVDLVMHDSRQLKKDN